ncbi:MAG: DUF4381 domain-containing protein [Pseudomonadota bacterium]
MMQASPDLSSLGLRDIHEPAAIGWWPLGPAWWVLLGLLIIVLVSAVVWWHKSTRLQRLATHSLSERIRGWRTHRDDQRLLAELSEWLRRVSIAAHGRPQVASLVGDEWRAFLDRGLAGAPFSSLPGSLLIDAAYRTGVPSLDPDTVSDLEKICQRWAKTVRSADQARARGGSS